MRLCRNGTSAETLGCGDAANLRTTLGEAAPLIQGWGLEKGFGFWEARAFVGGMGECARR